MPNGFFSIYDVGIRAYKCVYIRIGVTFIKYMLSHQDGLRVCVVYHPRRYIIGVNRKYCDIWLQGSQCTIYFFLSEPCAT